MGKLTWLGIARLGKRGCYGDGGGLYLSVSEAGTKSWIYRFTHDGRAREMGLGSLRDVSLAEAREKALECRKRRMSGVDPIAARREIKGREAVRKIPPMDSEPIEITSRPLAIHALLQLPMPRLATGIYFLFSGETLQYIGQSANCHQRVDDHRKARTIPFDGWRFIPTLMQDLDYVEAAYIRAHSPPFNRGLRRRKMNPLPAPASSEAAGILP